MLFTRRARASPSCGATPSCSGNTTLICPDGAPAGTSGCGVTNAQNRRWASSLGIAGDDPSGSYFSDAT